MARSKGANAGFLFWQRRLGRGFGAFLSGPKCLIFWTSCFWTILWAFVSSKLPYYFKLSSNLPFTTQQTLLFASEFSLHKQRVLRRANPFSHLLIVRIMILHLLFAIWSLPSGFLWWFLRDFQSCFALCRFEGIILFYKSNRIFSDLTKNGISFWKLLKLLKRMFKTTPISLIKNVCGFVLK